MVKRGYTSGVRRSSSFARGRSKSSFRRGRNIGAIRKSARSAYKRGITIHGRETRIPQGYEFDPDKTFPRDLVIQVPTSSPTLRMADVNKAIDDLFRKKNKR